jgi:hypothetical protein
MARATWRHHRRRAHWLRRRRRTGAPGQQRAADRHLAPLVTLPKLARPVGRAPRNRWCRRLGRRPLAWMDGWIRGAVRARAKPRAGAGFPLALRRRRTGPGGLASPGRPLCVASVHHPSRPYPLGGTQRAAGDPEDAGASCVASVRARSVACLLSHLRRVHVRAPVCRPVDRSA